MKNPVALVCWAVVAAAAVTELSSCTLFEPGHPPLEALPGVYVQQFQTPSGQKVWLPADGKTLALESGGPIPGVAPGRVLANRLLMEREGDDGDIPFEFQLLLGMERSPWPGGGTFELAHMAEFRHDLFRPKGVRFWDWTTGFPDDFTEFEDADTTNWASLSEQQRIHEPWLVDQALWTVPHDTDWRFTGSYASSAIEVDLFVPDEAYFFGIPVGAEGTWKTYELTDVHLRLRHVGLELAPMVGVVYGVGSCEAREVGSPDPPEPVELEVTAEVTGTGLARAVVTGLLADKYFEYPLESNFYEGEDKWMPASQTVFTDLWLDPDGNGLSFELLGNPIHLPKLGAPVPVDPEAEDPWAQTRPNDDAPTVAITAPADGATFTASETIVFEAAIENEGATGADSVEVVRWEADGSAFGASYPNIVLGELPDDWTPWKPRDRVYSTVGHPGGLWEESSYEITCTVMDAGGLIATDSITVHVGSTDTPLNPPEIVLPQQTSPMRAGFPITFLGRASDLEDGFLDGAALEWTFVLDGADVTPPPPQNQGRKPGPTFAGPGDLTATLTATDSDGHTASVSRDFRINPENGKSPPTVVIVNPDLEQTTEKVVFHGDEFTFLGQAWDFQTAPQDLTAEWIFRREQDPPQVLSNDAIFTWTAPDDGVTSTWRVTFRVTDTDGHFAAASVGIIVMKPLE